MWKTSAIISFCRTVIFMVIPVLILPRILKMDGVWMSIMVGEALSIFMVIFYFIKYRETWKYRKQAEKDFAKQSKNAEMEKGLPVRSENGDAGKVANLKKAGWDAYDLALKMSMRS